MKKGVSGDWFSGELGQHVIEQELAWFDANCADVFGFNAMQVGLCQLDYLRANRMPQRFCAAPHRGAVRCYPELLPIAGQSMDLLVLAHALEYSPNPHQLLREVDRVLRPEGHLLLAGFNPASLWGLRRMLSPPEAGYPWNGKFLHLSRLKDWLSLLGFEFQAGRMICYSPPLKQARWLRQFRFLEAAGDRWWALGGGVYLLHLIKRRHGMRLIAPKWDKTWLTRPVLTQPTPRVTTWE